jgi:hypothetical protein
MMTPLPDDDLRCSQAVENFAIQQLVTQLCCEIPASRHATGVDLPCASDTSIWRSNITTCSAPNLFFGMISSFKSHSLIPLSSKKPEQV